MTTENIVPFERRAKAPAAPQAPSNVEPGLGDVLREYAARGHRKAELFMARTDTIGDFADIIEQAAAGGWRLSDVGTGTMNGMPGIGAVFVPAEAETSEGQARSHAGFTVLGAPNRGGGTSRPPAGHVNFEEPIA